MATMPTIDFHENLILDDNRQLAARDPVKLAFQVLAYLAWPDDPRRRFDDALVTFERLMMDESGDEDGELLHLMRCAFAFESERVTRKHLAAFDGGFEALTEAANGGSMRALLAAGLKRAELAGYQFFFLWVMAEGHNDGLNGGASLKKASALLEHVRSNAGTAKSDYAIDAAWQSHQSIAHVAAAAMFTSLAVRGQFDEPSSKPAAGLPAFLAHPALTLAYAARLQAFGLDFRARRARRSVLDQAKTWRIPFADEARLPWLPANPRLPDDHLDFLIKN